jgi:hypothetical protein
MNVKQNATGEDELFKKVMPLIRFKSFPPKEYNFHERGNVMV